jgi:hypothetical protein
MTLISDKPVGGVDGRIPPAALVLGWAGVIPFAVGSAVMAIGLQPAETWAFVPLLSHAAVILSFLGGVRWGLGLRLPTKDRLTIVLAWSVVPSLVAWIAVCLYARPLLALALLIFAHAAQGWFDVRTAEIDGAPRWYAKLRLQLAAIVTLCLLAAAVGTALRGA